MMGLFDYRFLCIKLDIQAISLGFAAEDHLAA
jgi:hypothetical protein